MNQDHRQQMKNASLQQLPPAALIAISLLLLVMVILLQRFTASVRAFSLDDAPPEARASEKLVPPGVDAMTLAAKFTVKLNVLNNGDLMVEPGEEPEDLAETGLKNLDAMAVSRTERLRIALVAGELAGLDEAIARLDALSKEPNLGEDFAADVYWCSKLFKDGRDALDLDARESLIARHGWYVQLAMTIGLSEDEPYRQAFVSGGGKLLVYSVLYGLVMGLANLAGLGVLIYLIVRVVQGHIQSGILTAVGGPVNFEVVLLFAIGFVLFLLAGPLLFAMGVEGSTGGVVFVEVLSWSLAAALLWPRVRGVKWDRFSWEIGLSKGEGVGKEIWCGVLGFLAGLPITAAVISALAFFAALQQETGGSSDPSGFPLFDQPLGHSWWSVVLSVISLLIWAPVLEEIVFRGALYRYLHPKCRMIGTVLITSVAFGIIHPYGPGGMIEVAMGGVVLGLIREWRDSLIACMVAHALHNATIAIVTVGMLMIID